MPKSKLGQFSLFAGTQMLSYFLFVANGRAYTQGNYTWTAITDSLYAAQSFFLIRRMVTEEANNVWSFAGYVVGGVAGSLLSILVTTHIYGK